MAKKNTKKNNTNKNNKQKQKQTTIYKFIYQKTMGETVKYFGYIHTYCCYAFVFIQCLLPIFHNF